MIKILIVDDVKKSREALQLILQNYCPQTKVIGQASSAEEAFPLIQTEKPDLVLLDIEMPNGSGFSLLNRFESIDFEVIFTTAFDQYAIKAIKFCALDYLLKPIDIKELIKAIQKTEEKIRHSQERENLQHLLSNLKQRNSPKNKIALPTQEGLAFIMVDDIVRCEADGNYTLIYFKNGKKTVTTRKIKDFEELLNEHAFFRVHRSHLINLNCIEKYYRGDGGYVTMVDGSSIDVARRKKDDFLESLSRI